MNFIALFSRKHIYLAISDFAKVICYQRSEIGDGKDN